MSRHQEYVECPFTVAIDTREQHPWMFTGFQADADKSYKPLVVATNKATLKTGDYSIVGFDDQICIERKSPADAFSTFTVDRDRWERELERMSCIPISRVIIECGWDELIRGPAKEGGNKIGKTVFRSILYWQMRFPNVHWLPMPTREHAEACAFRILEAFWNDEQKRMKAKLGLMQNG